MTTDYERCIPLQLLLATKRRTLWDMTRFVLTPISVWFTSVKGLLQQNPFLFMQTIHELRLNLLRAMLLVRLGQWCQEVRTHPQVLILPLKLVITNSVPSKFMKTTVQMFV